MTKTKLEITGPYTPEHEGPFCTRDGQPVDLKVRNGRGLFPLAGYIGDNECLDGWCKSGNYEDSQKAEDTLDLMNAREVPAAREFWVNVIPNSPYGFSYETFTEAMKSCAEGNRTIHVREVLPGDGE